MSTLKTPSQHTPADWTVEFVNVDGRYPEIYGIPYLEIKAGCGYAGGNEPGFQFTSYMAPADAALIAAAPDLLEVLLSAELTEHPANPNDMGNPCICWQCEFSRKAKAAISKATTFPTRPADDDGEPQSSSCSAQKPEPGGDAALEDEPSRLGFTEDQIERADRLHDELKDRQWEGNP